MLPPPLLMTDERERPEHEHRRDAGADGGLREGDVHRVHHDEESGGQEAVDARQHHRGEEIPLPDNRDARHREQDEEGNVDEVGHSPSSSPFVHGSTPPASAARASACVLIGLVNVRKANTSTRRTSTAQ